MSDGWKDAKKELPEIEHAVLVYSSGQFAVMMRLKLKSPAGIETIEWHDGNRCHYGIDAWMPLPEPPNKERTK